jgi:hypothetical protein
MQGKPHVGACVLKGGFLFGGLMFVLMIAVHIPFPTLARCLYAPAMEAGSLWHEIGLPPHGEAGFLLPLLFMVMQCFTIGALIGLWRYRRLKRRLPSPSADKAASGIPPTS